MRDNRTMAVRALLLPLSAVVLLSLVTPASRAADTLVIEQPDGKIAPGLAQSWAERGDAVAFTLAPQVDLQSVASELRTRLSKVQVSVEGNELLVRGLALGELLAALSTTRLALAWDALSELTHLPNGPVVDTKPEVGGSIRASQPVARTPWEEAALRGSSRRIAEHDPAERVEADVLEIERGSFPLARIKLKLRAAIKVGALAGKVTKGATVQAAVAFALRQGSIDFSDTATQRNVGAYFLMAGDRVRVHLAGAGAEQELDFIERVGR